MKTTKKEVSILKKFQPLSLKQEMLKELKGGGLFDFVKVNGA